MKPIKSTQALCIELNARFKILGASDFANGLGCQLPKNDLYVEGYKTAEGLDRIRKLPYADEIWD